MKILAMSTMKGYGFGISGELDEMVWASQTVVGCHLAAGAWAPNGVMPSHQGLEDDSFDLKIFAIFPFSVG